MSGGAPELRTVRLLLRQWRDEDLEPYAALNGDAEVMRYFPTTLTQEQSDEHAARQRARLDEAPYGLWAVEAPGVAPFLGFVGLQDKTFVAHFTPAVEVGWRLGREHWGQGYAPEAARAVLAYAFGPVGLAEVVSMTAVGNTPSRRVMEKIGMTRDPVDDFDHPLVPEGHPLRRHVLYRIRGGQ